MLFSRHRFIDGARVLGVVFAQVNYYVFHACLFNAMRCRYNKVARNKDTTALIAGNANVRLPWILAKLGPSAANNSFLHCILNGAWDAAFYINLKNKQRILPSFSQIYIVIYNWANVSLDHRQCVVSAYSASLLVLIC